MLICHVGLAYGEYKGIERKTENCLHHKFDFLKNSALIDLDMCIILWSFLLWTNECSYWRWMLMFILNTWKGAIKDSYEMSFMLQQLSFISLKNDNTFNPFIYELENLKNKKIKKLRKGKWQHKVTKDYHGLAKFTDGRITTQAKSSLTI